MISKELEEAVTMFKNLDMGNDEEFKKARNRILKELERLREENKKYTNSYEAAEKIARTCTYSREDIYDVARMAFNVEALQEDYILKDKIREKIEEIREERTRYPYIQEHKIEILKELLEVK